MLAQNKVKIITLNMKIDTNVIFIPQDTSTNYLLVVWNNAIVRNIEFGGL